MIKRLKFAASTILAAITFCAACLCACNGEQNTDDTPSEGNAAKLEEGFYYSSGGCLPMQSERCAYRAETDTFDIDDVTVTFYFGYYFTGSAEFERECGKDFPEFDVYFAGKDGEQLHLVRHSTENFISDEYRVTSIAQEGTLRKFEFNHSEQITIPKELFTEEWGTIRFRASGLNVKALYPEYGYGLIAAADLNYDMVGDGKVKLSKWSRR